MGLFLALLFFEEKIKSEVMSLCHHSGVVGKVVVLVVIVTKSFKSTEANIMKLHTLL